MSIAFAGKERRGPDSVVWCVDQKDCACLGVLPDVTEDDWSVGDVASGQPQLRQRDPGAVARSWAASGWSRLDGGSAVQERRGWK